jgi:hypothetical protein
VFYDGVSLEDRIMSIRRIGAILAALVVAACGSSPQQTPPAGQAAPAQQSPSSSGSTPSTPAGQAAAAGAAAAQSAQAGAQQLAQGLQQMAQGLQQLGQKDAAGKPVPPVDFEKLVALLPDAAGWTKGKSSGQQTAMFVPTSTAQVTYSKGGMNVELQLTDSALNQMILGPFSMMMAAGYSERSSSGYKKSTTLGSAPAYEEWNSDAKSGEVTAVVANRFVVSGKGSNLDSIDSLRGVVSQVDLGKLAALK